MKRTIYRKAVCGYCNGVGFVPTTRETSSSATETCVLCNGNKVIDEVVIEEIKERPSMQCVAIPPIESCADWPGPAYSGLLPWTLEESRNKTNQS